MSDDDTRARLKERLKAKLLRAADQNSAVKGTVFWDRVTDALVEGMVEVYEELRTELEKDQNDGY